MVLWGAIFDLDNTLYRLRSPDGSFRGSTLNRVLVQRARAFLMAQLGMSREWANDYIIYAQERDGLSVMVEREYGIDRYAWFAAVWDLDPAEFIRPASVDLPRLLAPLSGRSLILTSGPRVWAERVILHLGIASMFKGSLVTGEPDERKPNPVVFRRAANMLGRPLRYVVSVGDTNGSDIVPAKLLGMRTIIVGPDLADAHYRAGTVAEAVPLILSWEK